MQGHELRQFHNTKPHRPHAGPRLYSHLRPGVEIDPITTLDQAREWTLRLHDFGQVFKAFLNEKTPVPKARRTLNNQWEWTHLRVRKAHNCLLHLSRKGSLFTYLQPPPNALEPQRWASTTNSLEGGVNAQLKRIAHAHRDRSREHQRKMLEWYLHSKTQLPDDPLTIARQCNFGQDQLAKVNDLIEEDHNKADHETGRPAFYDNAIPAEYEHSIGVRTGPMK